MTWYDIDLGKSGVQALNELFSESPYSFQENEGVTHNTALINIDGRNIAFLDYDPKKIVIFHGVIKDFPTGTKHHIHERLKQIDPLEKLLTKIPLF